MHRSIFSRCLACALTFHSSLTFADCLTELELEIDATEPVSPTSNLHESRLIFFSECSSRSLWLCMFYCYQ